MTTKAGNLFTTAYLLLIFCIYPFYMKEGYVDIGESKYHFFLYSSLAALLILAILAGVGAAGRIWQSYKKREAYLIQWEKVRISSTDLFVGLYVLAIAISYLLSDFPQEALWGTEGWRIGLVLLLILCGLYFLTSRQWEASSFVWYGAMAASGLVFLLGILDRFSIYLIPISIRDPAFISTLGNINWFCGYFSVLVPIGGCIYLFSTGSVQRGFSAVYLFLAFTAGFCQGSSSVFLFWAAMFLVLLWISILKREWIGRWFFLAALWGFSARAAGGLRALFPEGYNYETDNPCLLLADSNLILVAAVFCTWISFFLNRRSKRNPGIVRKYKMIRRILVGISMIGIILFGALLFVNTMYGVPGLAGNGFFCLGKDWGNGRGAAWRAGADAFARMSGIKMLFGAGPDCFSAYVYSEPHTAGMLRDYFGSSRLTNAHNELLTSLINTGVVGTFCYYGIFISGIVRGLKSVEGRLDLIIPAVCIFCYLVHNTVSFAQVLNLPFVFLIVAMGEAMQRKTGI